METQRLLLYLAFGFLSLIIWQTWVADYHAPAQPIAREAAPADAGTASPLDAPRAPSVDGVLTSDGDVPGALPGDVPGEDDASAVPERLVRVTTDVIDVALDTLGGTLAEVDLLEYGVSIDRLDEPFTLVSSDPLHYLVAQSGLQSTEGVAAPTHREPMSAQSDTYQLAEGSETLRVPLEWASDTGISVTKTFVFTRGSYEIGIEYLIDNGSTEPYTVNQYRQLKRKPGTKDERQQFVNTYIGGIVSTVEDRYTKYDFGDMEDENLDVDATDGWVAMIQHYFAAAWIPNPGEINTAYSRYLPNENRYLIGLVSAPVQIAPGAQTTLSTEAFIGPKIQDELAAAAPNLELTVDYGWLTIIAQPLFWLLKTIHSFVGNWGFAIILVTFCIKAVFYKLSEASYRSMARMKLLQPKLASLKEKHGDDRAAMGQATMELYKKEKVNPLGGCLPMIVQIPVFIALYWTLLESVELRHAPWILWIQDLSIRDPFFILPVIMAATMYFQQKLNPAPVDPIQQKVFQFLPLIFGVFFAFFPAGLVLYWVVNNSLSIAQQYYITRHVLAEKPGRPSPAASTGKPGIMSKLMDRASAKVETARAQAAAGAGAAKGTSNVGGGKNAPANAPVSLAKRGDSSPGDANAVQEPDATDDASVDVGTLEPGGTPDAAPAANARQPARKKRGKRRGKGKRSGGA